MQQIVANPDPQAKYNFHLLKGEYHRERKEYQKAIQCYNQADKLLDPKLDFLKGVSQQYCRDLMKQKK
jgi:tetratricopeptide (TPR) repeat protein